MVWAAFLCQTNSEFQALKTACFLKRTRFGREKRKKSMFCKRLTINDFHFLYIFRSFKSYALRLSELCFEPLTCGK